MLSFVKGLDIVVFSKLHRSYIPSISSDIDTILSFGVLKWIKPKSILEGIDIVNIPLL